MQCQVNEALLMRLQTGSLMTLSVSDGSPSRKEQNAEDEARIVSLCHLYVILCAVQI